MHTLLAAEFLVRGAVQHDETGVLVAFEETEGELNANMASLGYDLAGLVRRKEIVVDYVHREASQVQESGEYDLEGLFVRLGTRLIPSLPNAWYWTRWKYYLPDCPTKRSCAANCAGSSGGSTTRASQPSSPSSADANHWRATDWRNTSPTA